MGGAGASSAAAGSSSTTCFPSRNARMMATICNGSTDPSLLFIRGIDFPLPSKIDRSNSASRREDCHAEFLKSGTFGKRSLPKGAATIIVVAFEARSPIHPERCAAPRFRDDNLRGGRLVIDGYPNRLAAGSRALRAAARTVRVLGQGLLSSLVCRRLSDCSRSRIDAANCGEREKCDE